MSVLMSVDDTIVLTLFCIFGSLVLSVKIPQVN